MGNFFKKAAVHICVGGAGSIAGAAGGALSYGSKRATGETASLTVDLVGGAISGAIAAEGAYLGRCTGRPTNMAFLSIGAGAIAESVLITAAQKSPHMPSPFSALFGAFVGHQLAFGKAAVPKFIQSSRADKVLPR